MADTTKLTLDYSQVLEGLRLIDTALDDTAQGYAQLEAAAKKAGKSTEAAFNVGAAQGVADAIDDLQKEYDDLKRSADTLKSALKGATDPSAVKLYAGSIAQLELGMKKLEQTGKQWGVNLKENNRNAGVGKEVFENFFGSFTKASLIIAAIEAVRRFTFYAIGLAEETRKAQLQFTAFTGSAQVAAATVADLTAFSREKLLPLDDILQAGKSLLAFGENADNLTPVLSRIADISAATGKNFNELVTIYGKARTAGVLYAEDINQLVDAGVPIIQEFARQMGVSTDQVKKLASEGKISFEELQLAFLNLTADGAKFADQAEINADTIGGSWQRLVNVVSPAVTKIGEGLSFIVRKQLDLYSDAAEYIRGLFSDTPVLTADNEDRGELERDRAAYEKELSEREKLEAAAAKRRKELAKKGGADARQTQEEINRLRLAAMKDGEAKEIAVENARFRELSAQLRKYHLDTTEATEQHEANLSKIQVKYLLERYAAQQEAIEAERAQIEAGFTELEAIEQEGRDRIKSNAAKNSEVQKQAAQLQEANFEGALLTARAVFFEKKRTDEEIKEYDEQVSKLRKTFQLTQQREELERALTFNAELTEAEKATLEQRIKNITAEIEQIAAGVGEQAKPGKSFSIWSLLGIDTETDEGKKAAEQVKAAAAEIVGALGQVTAARLEEAQAAVQAADAKVQAAETALEREIELQQAGFASNVTARQQELDSAKAARAEAVAEQQKAARQQLALDSVQQASGIVSASVNLVKTWSAIPFGVGLIAAAAQVASIFALIANVRAKSRAISAQQFRKGGSGWLSDDGYVSGRSHEQGGHLLEVEHGELMQVGDDGGKRRVAIVRRERVAQYFDLLDAANRNDREAMAVHAAELSGAGSGGDYADIMRAAARGDKAEVVRQALDLAGIQYGRGADGERPSASPDRANKNVRSVTVIPSASDRQELDREREVLERHFRAVSFASEIMRERITEATERTESRTLEANYTLRELLGGDARRTELTTTAVFHRDKAEVVRLLLSASNVARIEFFKELAHHATDTVKVYRTETNLPGPSASGGTAAPALSGLERAADRITLSPKIDIAAAGERIFEQPGAAAANAVAVSDGERASRRTNELLEAILREVARKEATWSPDGKKMQRGNTTTTFL